ncbi:probable protein phosphatase 2C 63 [Dendrobium catenatum]|uniref:protein-serine/threonine phosphatase n=1 Tax=Dendrobium catenatum TaxID=906689 RepID=A0A2I0VJF0_9ASPA|nr:probable protein phosphatase 2C 63 [Dendrobium catenatum]PKU63493.1 putative protein phosphatase 2C 63 [Dendrobium catenatum]
MTMLRSCLERCFGRLGYGDELFWYHDLKPHTSGEFSIAVVQANSTLEDQGQVVSTPFATFIGVYDGHGGPDAARFVNTQLFPHFCEFAMEQKGVSADVMRKAIVATEEEFLHLVKRSFPFKPQIASVGSCCLVGAITEDTLYVANLGDSRAVLGRCSTPDGKEVVAERLTSDHNVADVEIRKELKKLHPDESDIVVHTRGVWRIKGIIQVSRSIGDAYLKKPEFSRDPLFPPYIFPTSPLKRSVISAEPSILTRKLKPDDLFFIFASDGFWEQLTDEAAVQIVSKYPRSGIAKRLLRAALEEAAKKMEMRVNDMKRIQKGVRRHFHDDITVIVVYLDHNNLRNSNSPNFKAMNYKSINTPADIFSLHSHESDSRLRPEPLEA